MSRTSARVVALAAVVLAAAGCGADTSATFNADGSVVVGMKFLFPKSLMQGGAGTTVSGFSPGDIADANKELQQKYPGGKVTVVAESDETGALITIPFQKEKDAFAFMTQPSKVSPSGATSGSSVGLNLGNTGGMFSSATHTSSGATDTYTFKTLAQQQPSPAPGQDQVITQDELASIFTITFAITGPDASLTASVSPVAQDWRLTIAIGFGAIAAGFLLGMFFTWRGLHRRPQPAPAPVDAPFQFNPGPPPGAPPPTIP
jgi:hypothetical protein